MGIDCFDLTLLAALNVLLEERSVTGAACQLNLTPQFLRAALRHFAAVLGLIPSSRLSVASEAGDMLYCCSDGVRGRGAPMTNLSHTASFHSNERIAPSNREIKHLRS
jgi:hypothetical protein